MSQVAACSSERHLCEDYCLLGGGSQSYFSDFYHGLTLNSICYQTDEDSIKSFQSAGMVLPQSLIKARPKRQAEYLAGRYCAMEGLKQQGAGQCSVLTNKDRSPCWPEGFTGSITHSNGLALAAVGARKNLKAIGIDAEETVTLNRAEKLARAVLLPEDHQLQTAMALPLDWFFTLAFSAKESLYKLLYPSVKRFFGFDSAVITDLDEIKQTFVIKLVKPLTDHLPAGQEYLGHYMRMGSHLVTLLYIS